MPHLQSAKGSAAKVYSTPSLFKDYNKLTKDLLAKDFPTANKWVLECKYKGPKDTFFINPKASSDGKISAEIEYVAACNGGLKVTVTPEIMREIKATAHYTIQGHKMEVALQRLQDKYHYEISHETCVALSKRASINEKLTPTHVELGMGIDVAPNCQVGCGATYDIGANDCNWNIGCRYAGRGCEMAIRTNRLQTYHTSASAPCSFMFNGNRCTVRAAVEVVCGRGRGDKGVAVTAGMEATCPVHPANTIKARVDRDMKWVVAYIAKMADNWTACLSLDENMRVGVQMTHS
ncbi:voltage-dependent anion-selective channel -putative / VDAC [Leishmania donovani]|uniref:Voltage-dependent_anion-selective_channel_-_putative n=3 Tax=Leishmania donovani species complex TaxID=38574 RepID=A0A6L0WP70_LEIIN|nr:conserved hypothetical protein [Leishmania infantum JPCM5]XP_003857938.1 hypothetical protein, conserved [Leishmania donovani]CAC9437963.1 voltage-dependent_anion-selective_channel_-_putative [Leishmania infantum]AYU75648.1 voltage-dependent anion-selective channel, putative [Leishmania donovani]TPP43104.1 hypothetical protein CGC21_30010 [Leishmania donovani]TPP43972.1 hypothetical protein CGC20_37120 [Leishmania donovani]CAJ1985717.1 voltage-dependent anion-selective channel -putative / |eukprot:XP_001462734.1 conserved hypothetical protein [Leishmania infantum JPCM5]